MQLDTAGHSRDHISYRLKWGSFVSFKHRLFYLDTPKAACTAMKWMLADIEQLSVPLVPVHGETSLEMCIHYRHINGFSSLLDVPPAQSAEILEGQDFRRICVVRNPYSRLVSAWADKIRQCEPGFGGVGDSVALHLGSSQARGVPAFRDFARWVVETADVTSCDGHWQPQYNLQFPDVINYTHILRVENLEEGLQAFLESSPTTAGYQARPLLSKHGLNRSLPVHWQSMYDEELALAVSRFYSRDFELFGYDKDSWKHGGVPLQSRESSQMESAALDIIRNRNRVIERLMALIPGTASEDAAA